MKKTHPAVCGKINTLWKHTSECPNAPEAKRQWAREELHFRELAAANKENARLRNQDSRGPIPAPLLPPIVPSSAPPPQPPSIGNDTQSLTGVQMQDGGVGDVFYGVSYSNGVTGPPEPWKPEVQAEFAADLCRLLLVCNVAWWAVDQPFWRFFFGKWLPQCLMPGSKQLSGRILDEEAVKVIELMKSEVSNKFATGQCDGWKNVNKSSIIASTINVEYTVCERVHCHVNMCSPIT